MHTGKLTHADSVRALVSLFRAHNAARPVLLLGAGASFSSGVPLAAECVRRLAKRVFAEVVQGGAVLPEHVKLTEWQGWLQSHPWFIRGEDRLAENFPLVVEHLLQPREFRARLLRDIMQPSAGVGAGYRTLADLVMRGLVRTILTTNFDNCLPTALSDLRAHLPHFSEVNATGSDLVEFDLYSRAQIVWLHGRAEKYTDRNDLDETKKLSAKLVDALVPQLASSPLVVMGYRGAEPSIVEHLLSRNAQKAHLFKKGIFWCSLSGEPLHPLVEALRAKVGANLRSLEIADFDSTLRDIGAALVGEDLYSTEVSSSHLERPLPFDDRPLSAAGMGDLDHDLLLTVMRTYCEQLGRSPVTAATLLALLREQGLVHRIDGADAPTAGCVLLFGRAPQKLLPHAVVSATIDGKKRAVFGGNLIQQRDQLLEWLQEKDVNPLLRVKRRATHESKTAYPHRALVELLVNLLVHRDYEVTEPSTINVRPGGEITFVNPGALPVAIAARVAPDPTGRFRPIPKVNALRNRSLCDVFFGFQAMEREGTGLLDVERMAEECGGATEFVSDDRNDTFVARILQPVASVGSTSVAVDRRETSTYLLNVLPFRTLPEEVMCVRLRKPLRERPYGLSLDEVGTFVTFGTELWTFEPVDVLVDHLGDFIDRPASVALSRNDVERDRSSRRPLSWLLRKHFEATLTAAADLGLVLEQGQKKGRRAYFVGDAGRPRTVTYDTARRRGIRRQVVKQRIEGPRAWFENEGVGYEVTRLDDLWCVRLKPFYMFTGRDAATPLPAFARASKATRRMKFDRNKNVEDDLSFWARFLGKGAPTINLGGATVTDLILDAAFLTVDVVEEGLVENEARGRVSA